MGAHQITPFLRPSKNTHRDCLPAHHISSHNSLPCSHGQRGVTIGSSLFLGISCHRNTMFTRNPSLVNTRCDVQVTYKTKTTRRLMAIVAKRLTPTVRRLSCWP